MNAAVSVAPARMMRIIPWTLTLALLSVWGFGASTASAMGGLTNAALISGAVMVLVSLFLGRRIISQPLTHRDSP